jgi:hypothetical protein
MNESIQTQGTTLHIRNFQGAHLTDLPHTEATQSVSIENCPNLSTIQLPPALFYRFTNLPSLRAICEFPPTTAYIDICGCPALSSLPDLGHTALGILCVRGSGLVQFPKLPTTIFEIIIENCRLDSIPPLDHLSHLTSLNTTKNRITQFKGSLPNTIRYLYCSENRFTGLPRLPIELRELYCGDNPHLTELPELPPNLQRLCAQGTRIRRIPPLPIPFNRILLDIQPLDEPYRPAYKSYYLNPHMGNMLTLKEDVRHLWDVRKATRGSWSRSRLSRHAPRFKMDREVLEKIISGEKTRRFRRHWRTHKVGSV